MSEVNTHGEPAPWLHPHLQAAGTSQLLRAGPPAGGASVLSALGFCLGTLPLATGGPQDPMNGRRYRHLPSHVPCKTCRPGSRRLYAGHRLANRRAPARLLPGKGQESPVSMSLLLSRRFDSDAFPCFPGRALLARLPGPHLMRSSRTFSLSLTTTVFSQRSTGWFDACPRRPTSEGHTSISCTASHPKGSYMAPPSAFVTHCPITSSGAIAQGAPDH